MAMIATSVTVVAGPHPEAERLDAEVRSLREGVLVAPGAALVGDVTLGEESSIWWGAVLRGDLAPVAVGARTNIQDGTVMHVADDTPCTVGDEVVVGHRA